MSKLVLKLKLKDGDSVNLFSDYTYIFNQSFNRAAKSEWKIFSDGNVHVKHTPDSRGWIKLSGDNEYEGRFIKAAKEADDLIKLDKEIDSILLEEEKA